jgi:arabinan endo-1,5-alpha-L-arabinosidase
MRFFACQLFRLALISLAFEFSNAEAQLPVLGDTYAHDPSRLTRVGNSYYLFYTSQGIVEKTSTDLRNWTDVSQVFAGNPPAWTTNAVPGFAGDFWAPDVIFLNGVYYLYYAVSTFGSQVSAIGLVTTTNLATGPWIDQGAVIQSTNGSAYNCIDPCPLVDTNGTMWLTFGSYWNGIYLMQLNPATGKRISANSTLTQLAYNSSIEGSFLYQQGGYYYLFVNWNTCCSGINSTYNIRVGRSTSVTGPYLDRKGVNMTSSSGSIFLESTARFIGPGQAGILNDGGINWLTYHYYDGNNNGTPALGLGQLTWSADGWPIFTNDWSAFYTFNVDAREHLGLYNGTLQNSAAVTNDPNLGSVLALNGVSQYALLPDPVANASTLAGWVKWNGGAAWQRYFDFGNGTNAYLFLTPNNNAGKMRFAITTAGSKNEQRIDAPAALPTNSWCHVAVTLDGSVGVLYLDGIPVATNTALTVRPWQVLARSNYLGHSQFAADPYFNGQIGSFRTFSRALSAAEIQNIAYAPPSLAHRYSFTNNAWDSIGMAHGTLMGNAVVTNGALQLTGATGGYVNLPGGLVSGSSAATIEFWATFGANGNWARVFDFGNISGANGQDFLFFTPHNSSGGVQLGFAVAAGTNNLIAPGTFDNQTLHVVCIVDPTNGYTALYTNGVLELAQTNALPALAGVNNAWSFIGHSLFSTDAWLNTSIDEFRIYDGRLTPHQIAVNDQFGPAALALPVNLAASNTSTGLSLSWPANAIGFALQSSPALGNGTAWTSAMQSSVLKNNLWQTTIPATNSAQFFRLRR